MTYWSVRLSSGQKSTIAERHFPSQPHRPDDREPREVPLVAMLATSFRTVRFLSTEKGEFCCFFFFLLKEVFIIGFFVFM